ncbi:MAG: pilus assembly protein TadG-related protein [Aeromicrobium sp.]
MHLQDPSDKRREGGQMLVLFAATVTVIIMVVGLVIDGGNALVQRREAQNAADFAALAGARIITQRISGDFTNGTDANVASAITKSMAINHASPVTFGPPIGPVYVDDTGAIVPSTGSPASFVGNGSIPAGASGVKVSATQVFSTYFVGLAGLASLTASAEATARGGYSAGPPSGVFPVGIAEAFFDGRQPCSGPVSTDPTNVCYPTKLTPGSHNVPGGFGWLKFGCPGYGLGQGNNGGCEHNKPFLQDEIGPPSNSYGCCTEVGLPGSLDFVGSLPGNKASADCDYYIDNEIVVTTPVWDYALGTGSNGHYHIIGFTGFQITNCFGGKNIEGVWRVPFFLGPTTTTPGFAGAPLAVQLIR